MLALKTKPKANKKPETEIKQTKNLEEVSSKGNFRLTTSGCVSIAHDLPHLLFLLSLMWRNPYFSELLLPFQNDIIYSPLDVMLAFNVHCYKQFAMEIIHIVHIWGKAFEYPHVHVMLKWDVLGDSASERCHSS